MVRLFIAVVASLATPAAHSQAPRVADPADARVAVPALRHDSAFAGYRTARDEKPAPWKALNEEVAAIGGHPGHVRALEKAAVPSVAPAPSSSPSPSPSPSPPPRQQHKH